MENYKFAIPVKVDCIVDETMLNIDCVEDLEDLQEIYDIDLSFVSDKYEYKINHEDYEDEEFYNLSNFDVFNEIVNDCWFNIIKKLNRDYKLKDLDDSIINDLFDYTKKNFDSNIIKFEKPFNFNIYLESYDKIKSEFIVNIEIEKNLTKKELEIVREWLDTQTSDSWGEEFSKEDLSDHVGGIDNMFIYLTPWSLKKEVRIIK